MSSWTQRGLALPPNVLSCVPSWLSFTSASWRLLGQFWARPTTYTLPPGSIVAPSGSKPVIDFTPLVKERSSEPGAASGSAQPPPSAPVSTVPVSVVPVSVVDVSGPPPESGPPSGSAGESLTQRTRRAADGTRARRRENREARIASIHHTPCRSTTPRGSLTNRFFGAQLFDRSGLEAALFQDRVGMLALLRRRLVRRLDPGQAKLLRSGEIEEHLSRGEMRIARELARLEDR